MSDLRLLTSQQNSAKEWVILETERKDKKTKISKIGGQRLHEILHKLTKQLNDYEGNRLALSDRVQYLQRCRLQMMAKILVFIFEQLPIANLANFKFSSSNVITLLQTLILGLLLLSVLPNMHTHYLSQLLFKENINQTF